MVFYNERIELLQYVNEVYLRKPNDFFWFGDNIWACKAIIDISIVIGCYEKKIDLFLKSGIVVLFVLMKK